MFTAEQRVIVATFNDEQRSRYGHEGFKLGRVNYVRVHGNIGQAVSVFLDDKMAETQKPPFPNYFGTIFPYERVSALIAPSRAKEILRSIKDSGGWSDNATIEENKQLGYIWSLCPGHWNFTNVVEALANGQTVFHE